MDKYIINENTLALLTIDNKVKVVEKYIDFYIEGSLNNIINDSCIHYGSTFLGRMHSAKSLLGISTKLPIRPNPAALITISISYFFILLYNL